MNREEYQRQYYLKHKDTLAEKSKKWAANHRDEANEQLRNYRSSVPPGKSHRKRWSQEELDILVNNWDAPAYVVAEEIGRTICSIEMKRYELKNMDYHKWDRKTQEQKTKAKNSTTAYRKSVEPGLRHYQRWTKRQIEFATDPEYTAKEAAEELGRTIGSIYVLRNKYRKGEV